MSRAPRLEMDPEGVRQLLHSDGVRQNLKERADRIAANVSQHPSVVNNQVPVLVTEGDRNVGHRPHVWVRMNHPAAMRIEAKYRVLGAAIDSARG